eukprot:1160437-Pelagomonas_calceolata.AAC.13
MTYTQILFRLQILQSITNKLRDLTKAGGAQEAPTVSAMKQVLANPCMHCASTIWTHKHTWHVPLHAPCFDHMSGCKLNGLYGG